jgi:nucleoside-diphosphate-sugar epimerase
MIKRIIRSTYKDLNSNWSYSLVNLSKTRKYLVLGHDGFLGRNISSSLINNGNLVFTPSTRITLENLESIAKQYFTNDTIIVNCIASGVTPNSGGKFSDDYANAKLLEGLLEFFTKSNSHRFIQFGTVYEIDKDVNTLAERVSYVNSKVLGSQICKNYAETDKRIKLIYLPTVLNHNQPEGRFFIDFIESSFGNLPFTIKYPDSKIKVVDYESFFRYICKVIDSIEESVYILSADATMTVVEFSTLLNKLLTKNGYRPVKVLMNESHQINNNEINFDDVFVKKIEEMIVTIAGRNL